MERPVLGRLVLGRLVLYGVDVDLDVVRRVSDVLVYDTDEDRGFFLYEARADVLGDVRRFWLAAPELLEHQREGLLEGLDELVGATVGGNGLGHQIARFAFLAQVLDLVALQAKLEARRCASSALDPVAVVPLHMRLEVGRVVREADRVHDREPLVVVGFFVAAWRRPHDALQGLQRVHRRHQSGRTGTIGGQIPPAAPQVGKFAHLRGRMIQL